MNNRKIKFRVWHNAASQFLYYGNPDIEYNDGYGMYLVPENDYSSIEISNLFETPLVFQQYTGLTDRNGKEIYEGDIIKYHQHGVVGNTMFFDVKYFIAEIVWNDCQYHIVRRNFEFPEGKCDKSDPLHSGLQSHIEIIGNICENSELMPK